MKKELSVFMMLCLSLILGLSMASCSKENEVNNPEPVNPVEEIADYTIILYGTSGGSGGMGSIERGLIDNLMQVDTAQSTNKVNFTALMKWCAYNQKQGDQYKGVRRYDWVNDGSKQKPITLECFDFKKDENSNAIYNPEPSCIGVLNHMIDTQYSADKEFKMYDPENITKFIDESVERYPAKHYILITWDHGGGFNYDDAPKTKAMLWDDNLPGDPAVSVFELQKGIENSKLGGRKLDVIYNDLCLLSNIESMYQLRNCARYYMGAANVTPDLGGNYTSLIEILSEGDELAVSLSRYVSERSTEWVVSAIEGYNASLEEFYQASPEQQREWILEAREKNPNLGHLTTEELVKKVSSEDTFSQDLSCFDLTQIDDCVELLNAVLEDFSIMYDELSLEEKKLVAKVVYFQFKYDDDILVDITSTLSTIADSLKNELFAQEVWLLKRCIEHATIATSENITNPYNYSNQYFIYDRPCMISINWCSNRYYEAILSEAYPYSDFDKLTHWSEFLKKFEDAIMLFGQSADDDADDDDDDTDDDDYDYDDDDDYSEE